MVIRAGVGAVGLGLGAWRAGWVALGWAGLLGWGWGGLGGVGAGAGAAGWEFCDWNLIV